ncbi:MAG: YciL protein [uncultured Acetobacteraceae bacterium]|uniref:YciL protein n=1 Tax=uncultured Acetobacteraceae bacterium TaxID=169975 RepID=A0A6J4J0A6_9PROT|nr:MAG: YciL protein [uncultured Acetobacteraceae bacterium]
MGYAIIAWDGEDEGALERRMAARDRHMAVITEWAADGRLALGVPLFTPDWKAAGSLMLLEVPDRAGLDAYLAAEPFAEGGVWKRVETHPFRIAPLPYRPLPRPGTPVASARTHTVIIARDGADEGAEARRLAVRQAHMERVSPMAAAGTLAVGGAILDEAGGRMVGSIAVTAHADDAAARAWMAEDPYVTGGVWRDISLHGTRFAPLPYRPLPGSA